MVQEYLCPLLVGLLFQDLLVLPQGENLVIHEVRKHTVDIQLAQDLFSVLLENLSCPSLLPGAWPPATPLLLSSLLLHEPPLGATAKHL